MSKSKLGLESWARKYSVRPSPATTGVWVSAAELTATASNGDQVSAASRPPVASLALPASVLELTLPHAAAPSAITPASAARERSTPIVSIAYELSRARRRACTLLGADLTGCNKPHGARAPA